MVIFIRNTEFMKFRSKLILIFVFFSFPLFFCGKSYAQFTNADSALVESVFNRNLDHKLIDQYFSSEDDEKINAALLSIANCGDTTFLSSVLSQDFDNHQDAIVFALKKLGPNVLSKEYLIEKSKIFDRRKTLDALGAIADSASLNNLLNEEIRNSNFNFSGLPLLIYQAASRGINLDSAAIDKILSEELNNKNSQSKFDALFALYRLGPSPNLDSLLIKTLEENLNTNDFPIAEYALGCLRKMKFAPKDSSLFQKLISSKNWKIRTEFVRAYSNYIFNDAKQLIAFANLINDDNPNVALQTAVSLRNIKFANSLEDTLILNLTNIFSEEELSNPVKGELFITLLKILSKNKIEFFEEKKDEVDYRYVFESLINNSFRAKYIYEFIEEEIPELDERDLQYAAEALVSLQDSLGYDSEYRKSINTLLNSNFPQVLAVTALGLDSAYVNSNYPILQQLIFEQVLRNLNDPNFSETLILLSSLAEKLGEDFAGQIFAMMKTSELNSIRNFAAEKLGEEIEKFGKDEFLFSQIWKAAFKYNSAIVHTNKGKFQIDFYQGYAPVSVGNFVKLAEDEFFTEVLFHRVVPDFVIQTGDPTSTGWSGPGYEIISEFSYLPFERSVVGMASAGKDTEGSQWFVMHNNYPHLNGNYTVFGKVVSGMETVDKIEYGDIITKIELTN